MIDLQFAAPPGLWLLLAPAGLLLLWSWHVLRRHRDLRRLRRRQALPLRDRFRVFGDSLFWLAVVGSVAWLILAVARPVAETATPERSGLDIVVLQDGSASMRVQDVARAGANERDASGAEAPVADRWQRAMRFLRELGDALSWNDDRLAMVTFAHVAAPQIRLTRDPNTLFFFLDHLHARPPFRLEDETTWDTNLEHAVNWGLRVVEKDEELHGRSTNAAIFVMVSDGEAWSGEVAKSITALTRRGIPLYVIGVGTLGGAALPTVRTASGELLDSPGTSRLERAALQRIAAAGGGQYFELDRDGDRHIANTIVSQGRRRAPVAGVQRRREDLYWWFLVAAGVTATLGVLSLTRRTELVILLAGSIAAAFVLR